VLAGLAAGWRGACVLSEGWSGSAMARARRVPLVILARVGVNTSSRQRHLGMRDRQERRVDIVQALYCVLVAER